MSIDLCTQSPVVVTEDEQSLSDSDAEAVTETHHKKDSPKPKKASQQTHRAIIKFDSSTACAYTGTTSYSLS